LFVTDASSVTSACGNGQVSVTNRASSFATWSVLPARLVLTPLIPLSHGERGKPESIPGRVSQRVIGPCGMPRIWAKASFTSTRDFVPARTPDLATSSSRVEVPDRHIALINHVASVYPTLVCFAIATVVNLLSLDL
jgi:hypothetical protein